MDSSKTLDYDQLNIKHDSAFKKLLAIDGIISFISIFFAALYLSNIYFFNYYSLFLYPCITFFAFKISGIDQRSNRWAYLQKKL